MAAMTSVHTEKSCHWVSEHEAYSGIYAAAFTSSWLAVLLYRCMHLCTYRSMLLFVWLLKNQWIAIIYVYHLEVFRFLWYLKVDVYVCHLCHGSSAIGCKHTFNSRQKVKNCLSLVFNVCPLPSDSHYLSCDDCLRIRGRLSALFSAVLCTTNIVHSYKYTHMSSSYNRCTRDCWFRFRHFV